VRDLSRELGKQIDLEISGEETELDKSIVEEIGDPLVHIIRNSCDHGIEDPKDRAQAGKPEKGVIQLKAYNEGNHIVVEIVDDGKGIDP
ncbi:ATP-binding protein, partial [Helicobacter cinaedi]